MDYDYLKKSETPATDETQHTSSADVDASFDHDETWPFDHDETLPFDGDKDLPELDLPPQSDTNSSASLYSTKPAETKIEKRSTKKMGSDEYHQRLLELNTNAENKHYVLFFGKPASGKTFIIGSILYYMKNVLGGTVYLDEEKTTDYERKLFSQIQDRFAGEFCKDPGGRGGRTPTGEYFEFHIHFSPKDSTKPPLDIVFVDAAGEHSEDVAVAFSKKNNDERTGKLPDYLRVILESDVNTKLAFVYDKFLPAQENAATQVSMLDQIFTKIQLLQRRHKKYFPKILLLAKSDRIESEDSATVKKYGYSATEYAKGTIPRFANGFFNEDTENNKVIFYKMGIFSETDDLLLKFDEECPAKLFKWLYRESLQINLENPPSCWDKFMSWFKGK